MRDQPAESSVTPPAQLEGLHRAILESALDCIITMDAQGIVREFNPAAETVFGYRREEAVGRELAELIVPESLRERHRQGLAHYLKTGEGPVLGRRIEITAIRSDGTEILVELAITAVRLENTPIFTAYLREITEKVRAERRRTALYHIAGLLAGSWSLGEAASRIIQTIAASGQWVFGSIWARDDEGGHRCAGTWHAGDEALEKFAEVTGRMPLGIGQGVPGRVMRTAEHLWLADVTQNETFVRATEARTAGLRSIFAFPLCANGQPNGALELLSRSVESPDEDLLQMVEALGTQIGLFIHRRRIEKELQTQKEKAEAANAAKDNFLATLSHELRTPLTPVLIWAGGMARQEDLAPEVAEGLRMICRNVELEARLIDDLLDLTRITRGKLRLHLQESDLHEVIRHAHEIVTSELANGEIEISLDLEAARHRLPVDATRLQQVFWNILKNACKFTDAGGDVAVRSWNPDARTVRFEISDSGVGIEPQHLGKIFDAFEQGAARREGLGLGLAISKAVVEMHGGRIAAHSEGLGRGATFIIDLPIPPATA